MPSSPPTTTNPHPITTPTPVAHASDSPPAHANQACQRCYRRKKRCDRLLPRCGPCAGASTRCSFADWTNETGVYRVSYVRRLQERVETLEGDLKRVQNVIIEAARAQRGNNGGSPPVQSREVSDRGAKGGRVEVVSPDVSMTTEKSPENLETGVQLLSLEAVAERYLGSSSGVTFARLTQAVLKRLKPDLEPFSFTTLDGDEVGSESVHDAPGGAQASFSVSTSATGYTTTEPSPTTAPDPSPEAIAKPVELPPEDHAQRMTEFYFSHSHTLYPFVRKAWFMENLRKMYGTKEEQSPLMASPSWMYTMWMVFAIGSTSLSSVLLSDETESVRFWRHAMCHFEMTLQGRNMAVLSSILLQVSYSFFNQVGPNTWYLIGMAIRIALGMGLHAARPKSNPFPRHVQEYRSRVFFSLYMMDRLVSITLGRPFGIRDEDIEIEYFTAADDANILPDQILPHQGFTVPLTAVPLHIVALRRLAGQIFQQVYSPSRCASASAPEKDRILHSLHEKLITWRRTMPFPLPIPSRTLHVPHLTTAWWDLNYHTHVIMIYRPSPICPSITVSSLSILADSAVAALRHIGIMRANKSFSFNWLNLFALFTTTLALVYAVTAQPDQLGDFLSRSGVLEELRLACDVLGDFARKFKEAGRYRGMVREVVRGLEGHLTREKDVTGRSGVSLNATAARELDNLATLAAARPHAGTGSSSESFTAQPGPLGAATSFNEIMTQFQGPGAMQMRHDGGLFDDFAAIDLVPGFDVPDAETLLDFGGTDDVLNGFFAEGMEGLGGGTGG